MNLIVKNVLFFIKNLDLIKENDVILTYGFE